MNRLLSLLSLLLLSGGVLAQQVGVNTRTPAATLDVRSHSSATPLQHWRNTAGTILATVLSSGNVGIGTTAPTTRLHLDGGTSPGAIRIVDGTQGVGKVLTSDATGVGQWALPATNVVIGTLGAGVNVPTDATRWYYTGSSITLPPGKWLVYATMIFGASTGDAPYNVWLRSTFQDDTSTGTLQGGVTTYSPDIVTNAFLICGQLPRTTRQAILTGSVVIHNQTTASKTYYYVGGWTICSGVTGSFVSHHLPNFGNNTSGENIIYAIRLG